MSFLKAVRRETKGACFVRETASGSLQAIYYQKQGYTRTEKNTKEGADILIRWINQTHARETNKGLLPNPEQRRPYDVSDVIEWYRNHPTPKRNPKSRLTKADLCRLDGLKSDPIAKISLADENILISFAHKYVATMRASEVEETTLEREVALFKAMFNKARLERFEGLPDIPNPFKDIKFYYDPEEYACTLACTRFRRRRVRCFNGTGGGSWRGGSLHASSSLRLCG